MMHLIYIDESRDEKLYVFSALAVAEVSWQKAFRQVRQFRMDLRDSDGMAVQTEFHAWKFVSGRGNISDRVVTKGRRCAIFRSALEMTATLPGAQLINVVSPAHREEEAFDALLDGIDRTVRAMESHALLIFDTGKETIYTRLARRRRTYNPATEGFEAGDEDDRILEDPFYKQSDQSYFIQLADFCAYALLRRENPLPSKTAYGLDKAFEALEPILAAEAAPAPSLGVIRLNK